MKEETKDKLEDEQKDNEKGAIPKTKKSIEQELEEVEAQLELGYTSY